MHVNLGLAYKNWNLILYINIEKLAGWLQTDLQTRLGLFIFHVQTELCIFFTTLTVSYRNPHKTVTLSCIYYDEHIHKSWLHTYIYVYIHCVSLTTLCCITLHYTILITLRYVTLHYITLRYAALHCIAWHYITCQHMTLHYIPFHYIYTYRLHKAHMSSPKHFRANNSLVSVDSRWQPKRLGLSVSPLDAIPRRPPQLSNPPRQRCQRGSRVRMWRWRPSLMSICSMYERFINVYFNRFLLHVGNVGKIEHRGGQMSAWYLSLVVDGNSLATMAELDTFMPC